MTKDEKPLKPAASAREERLAKALRENLKRPKTRLGPRPKTRLKTGLKSRLARATPGRRTSRRKSPKRQGGLEAGGRFTIEVLQTPGGTPRVYKQAAMAGAALRKEISDWIPW